jgi:uncharacterized protein
MGDEPEKSTTPELDPAGPIEFEFDPVKDVLNLRDHKVSLNLAKLMDWDNALVWLDQRFAYSEIRMSALAPFGDTLYFVAYVDRGNVRRPISLRKATRKEVERYVKDI